MTDGGWEVWGHLRKVPSSPHRKLHEGRFTKEQAARFSDRMFQMGYVTQLRWHGKEPV